MGALDFLKGLKDRTIDAATYQLLERNFEMQEENNRLLKEKAELFQEENAKVKAENDALRVELRTLREQLSHVVEEAQYAIKKGIAFRRNPDGLFDETPLCPNCHKVLGSVGSEFTCPSCGYVTLCRQVPEGLVRQLNNAVE